jgi:predicted GNAT family acetyltransferase
MLNNKGEGSNMEKKLVYEFSQATEGYAEDIAATTQYYYNRFSNDKGFLAGYRTCQQVLSMLDKYYIVTINNQYIGHVQVSFGLPEEFKLLKWYENGYLEELKNCKKVIYIEHIVVKNEFTGMGAGRFLFQSLSNNYPDYILFSSVIDKPFSNKYSLEFHKQCGFKEVAYHKKDVIGSFTFQSIYLMKEAITNEAE